LGFVCCSDGSWASQEQGLAQWKINAFAPSTIVPLRKISDLAQAVRTNSFRQS